MMSKFVISNYSELAVNFQGVWVIHEKQVNEQIAL